MSDPGPIVGVANLDYEAAARTKYYDTVNRQVIWCEWDDLEDDEREELVADMRPYVDAALGLTENELRPPGPIRELSEILDDITEDPV